MQPTIKAESLCNMGTEPKTHCEVVTAVNKIWINDRKIEQFMAYGVRKDKQKRNLETSFESRY